MARTRATDRSGGDALPVRRNPSRTSNSQAAHPSRHTKRSHNDASDGSEISSDDGAMDSAKDDSDRSATSDSGGDIGSSSDVEFGSSSRREASRTSSRIAAAQTTSRRRSARQVADASPKKAGPLLDSTTRPRTPRRTPKRGQPNKIKPSRTPSKRPKELSAEPEAPISEGVTPDWMDPRIPYAAWTDIFYYAATVGASDNLDADWLIGAATTCKAFCEPALAAIYRNPPITTSRKATRLATLLERSPSETRINYRTKVESLYLDIAIVSPLVSCRIIHPLPRLKELIFYSQYDQPPYRALDRRVRWSYCNEIFNALCADSSPMSESDGKPLPSLIKSWEWSGMLLGGDVADLNSIARLHTKPFFSQLTKLSFTNFQVPSLRKLNIKAGDEEAEAQLYEEDGVAVEAIAAAIAQLKSLSYLIFESSTVMNDRLLPLLPKNLTHLGLINCWEVKSEDLTPFLHSHGAKLRSLVLSHNQSLDMAFLTDLADACPNLEELHMNLSYFRHHISQFSVNSDSDPFYDQALLPSQIPKWPSSLRVINLEHVRHWSVETAEMFLQNLIDSASNLPNLRFLAVKTMLNIPWKARANMRHEWSKKLDRVFLRPFVPPRNISTLRQPEVNEDAVPPPKKKRLNDERPSRRSGRLAAQASDSDSRHSSNSKGLRSVRDRPLYREPDTDEDEFDESDEEPEKGATGEADESKEQTEPIMPTIQGLCKIVAIVFDNQKPTEQQFGMEDFMDEDRSEDDEEWNGDEDEEDDTVFVWR